MTASDHLKHRTGSLGGDQIPEDLEFEYKRSLSRQPISNGEMFIWPNSFITQLIERIAKAEKELADRTKNADYLRSMVGSCHLMISRNDMEELRKEEWDPCSLPPRLYKFIKAALDQKTRECEEKDATISDLRIKWNGALASEDAALRNCRELQAQVERLGRQVVEMQWQEITESNLPKIGAEIFGHAEYEGKQWTNVSSVTHVHEQWDFKDFNNCGWTHFRSINAPYFASRARTK